MSDGEPMELVTVEVEKPDDVNVIIGQSHFIKTAEDVYEAMVNSVPGVRFGVAFCEASMDRLVRVEGNDDELRGLAARNALAIGCGHMFLVMMRECYPVNVLQRIKAVPEVCGVFCATANDLSVVVAVEDGRRGVMGVIDGMPPLGVEVEDDVGSRRGFLRDVGYKL